MERFLRFVRRNTNRRIIDMTDKKQSKCPRCDGDGWIEPDEATCPDCQGTGKKSASKEPETPRALMPCGKKKCPLPGKDFEPACDICARNPASKKPETPRAPKCSMCGHTMHESTIISGLWGCRCGNMEETDPAPKEPQTDKKQDKCQRCDGKGWIYSDGGNFILPCPDCQGTGKKPAPKEPDGIMKYISNDYANGHIIRELQAEIDALTQKVAELEGCLSGDPHLTATKEEREHWRHCAILYSNKLEQKVKDLEAEIKKKDEELMVRDKALELMAGHTIKVDWYLKQAKKLLIKKDASKKPDDKCSKCANNGIECLTCWAIIGEDADDNFKPKRKGIGKK
jgi:hypothetical protein